MKSFLILLLAFCASQAFAQDKLTLKSGKVSAVSITEIGVIEIKFTKPNGRKTVIYSVLKDDVARIDFEDGTSEVFLSDLSNPDIYAGNKRQAIKIGFFGPLLGTTTLSYERNRKPGFGWETSVSFIGMGQNLDETDPVGMGLRIGPKFVYTPDFHVNGLRYMHLLQGLYIKPEVVLATYKDQYQTDENGTLQNREGTINYGVFLINIGKQWVFQNVFAVDIFAGGGYGLISTPNGYDHDLHLIAGGTDNLDLVFSAGLKLGILIR